MIVPFLQVDAPGHVSRRPVRGTGAHAAGFYVCADVLEEWFQAQVDVWVNSPAARRQRNLPISVLVYSLMQNTYTTISWEHVAEAFREGY